MFHMFNILDPVFPGQNKFADLSDLGTSHPHHQYRILLCTLNFIITQSVVLLVRLSICGIVLWACGMQAKSICAFMIRTNYY